MGTWAHVIVVGGPTGLGDATRARLYDLEQRWTRFDPSSELMQLNAAAGQFVAVSPETLMLVQRGLEGWQQTNGLFDPTVLGALIRAGYDRDFALLSSGDGARDGDSDLVTGCQDVLIFGGSVRLPVGTGFDSGGIGKGLAADIACQEAIEAGADGVCVNIGGDLCARGSSPEGWGWTVSVDHPRRPEPLVLVGLLEGSMATSTTLLRRWRAGGEQRHHIIDPVAGRPAETRVALATVVAHDAWEAEVLVKAVILNPAATSVDILAGSGAEGLAVTCDGRVNCTDGFGAYIGAQVLPEQLLPDEPSTRLPR
jgi:FAD:protein FMN transferase